MQSQCWCSLYGCTSISDWCLWLWILLSIASCLSRVGLDLEWLFWLWYFREVNIWAYGGFWIVNWQAVSRRILRHVSRHACCSRSPGRCVVLFLLWLGLVLFCFVEQGSSCRLLFDLEFAGTWPQLSWAMRHRRKKNPLRFKKATSQWLCLRWQPPKCIQQWSLWWRSVPQTIAAVHWQGLLLRVCEQVWHLTHERWLFALLDWVHKEIPSAGKMAGNVVEAAEDQLRGVRAPSFSESGWSCGAEPKSAGLPGTWACSGCTQCHRCTREAHPRQPKHLSAISHFSRSWGMARTFQEWRAEISHFSCSWCIPDWENWVGQEFVAKNPWNSKSGLCNSSRMACDVSVGIPTTDLF